jgi:hypothetical protein
LIGVGLWVCKVIGYGTWVNLIQPAEPHHVLIVVHVPDVAAQIEF